MHKFLKFLLILAIFPLSTVCAAHQRSYETGSNDDVPWLSGELLGPGVAVEPWGSLVGTTKPAQVGWFSNLVSEVTSQFTNGVILSTGRIEQGATVTNYSDCTSWGSDETMNYSTTGDRDSDLARSSDVQLKKLSDVAGLVLYVVPKNKTINIPFMMASEEFFYPYDDEEIPNFNNPYDAETYADYSDKFAFFLKKGKMEIASEDAARDMGFTADDNIARLPDGSMVEIATVNQYTNQAYFVANVVTNGPNDRGEDELNLVFPTGDMPIPMEYNGAIIGPTAVCTNVEPGEVYTIKIVISDYGDRYNNSVIFLKDHGITSGADLKIDVTGPVMLSEAGDATIIDTVSNVGAAPAEGVQVTHYLPIGVDPETVKGNIKCSVGEVDPSSWGEVGGTNYFVWTIGDGFASGSNAVMTISCNLPAPGSYTNCATVVTSTGDYDEDNNTDAHETKVAAPDTTPITIKVDEKTDIYTGKPLKASYTKTEGEFAEGDQLYVTFDVESITDAGKTNVTVSGYVVSNGTEEVTAKYTIAVIPGWLEVTKRNVTLTSSGAEKTYDGTPLKKDEVVVSGDGFADGEKATWTVTGTQTFVGESDNTFTYQFDESIKPDNYDVTTQLGRLKVTAIETPIIIDVKGTSRKYDGTALTTESDVSYFFTDGVLKGGDELQVVLTEASITDAGATNVAVVSYKVMHDETDVTDCYTFGNSTTGTLEVLCREVTLTSASAKKTYDGTPLTTNKVEVSGDDFAEGEGATYSVTGQQIEAGVSDNVFTYELVGKTKPVNYDITCVLGKLEVTKLETPILIEVTGKTRKYDGTAMTTESDVSRSFTENVLKDGDELIITLSDASITDAGRTNVVVTSYKVMRGETDVTGCYTFGNSTTGTLEVLRREVTLTSASAKKPYDGTPLTTNKVEVSGDDFAEGEGATYSVTGQQLEAGISDNVFTYELVGQTKPINYDITCVTGKLEVTKVVTPLKITVDHLSKQYDRQPLVATWKTEGTLVGTDKLIVTPSVASITDVGSCEVTVTCQVMRGSSDVAATDYDVTIVPGSLEVTKRPLTITARGNTKKYGTPTAFSGKEYAITGGKLLAGDTITQVILSCKGCDKAAPYKDEGYPIEVKKVMGNGLENYDITTVNGVLKIVKLPLTITATDTNKVYGVEVNFAGTEFAITSGKFVNDDVVTKVTLTSEGAAATAPWKEGGYLIVADYPVTGKGFENYDITFEGGKLTVDKRKITITAGDTNKVYGTEIELDRTAFEITEGELAEGDSVTNVTLTSEGTVSNAVCLAEGYSIVPSHAIFGQIETNNYEIAFSNGTLTVTQALLTITVNDAKWRVGKPRPSNSLADFSNQLKAGDTMSDITGGVEFTADAYSNTVWNTTVPTKANKGFYPDEIWLDLSKLTGTRKDNYEITVDPGDLTVASAEVKFEVTLLKPEWDYTTGYNVLTLEVKNVGDDEIDPEYDYWVELMPGTNVSGEVTYCLVKGMTDDRKLIRTDHRPDGYDYINLTEAVKNALMDAGGDTVFDPGETVKIGGILFYQSAESVARDPLNEIIGEHPTSFFMAGELFCPSDTNQDFIVSEAEKLAAKDLLGESSADYLEVTRLSCLLHYHWDAKEANWVGPSKDE